ncbi:hypothetical protein [Serinicoccus kebangsaanensis]|uniref:hypothetical protein n=1 Tax=Serinicoccus kebangsaanensis TaxID=2602069 RepID=UPI00124C7E06|nr:hypothetical protein [Serinicoccus kebangsaanensis]
MTPMPDLLTDPEQPPPPPPTLAGKPRALDLWQAVTSRYALRADELVVLEQACRMLAVCDHLAEALAGQPLVVEGSMKQPAPHPLLPELRAHRSQLAALLRQLHLPDELAPAGEDGGNEGASVSELARKAARARWDKHAAQKAR